MLADRYSVELERATVRWSRAAHAAMHSYCQWRILPHMVVSWRLTRAPLKWATSEVFSALEMLILTFFKLFIGNLLLS